MAFHGHFSETELGLLRARARRSARPVDDEAGTETIAAFMTTIQAETWALPLEKIAGVYKDVPVIPVPNVPPYVAGIANIRGHIVPVLELSILLGVPGGTVIDRAALVMATTQALTVAFQVDAISDTVMFQAADLMPVASDLDQTLTNYVQGVLADGSALLDVDGLLNDPALIVDETLSQE